MCPSPIIDMFTSLVMGTYQVAGHTLHCAMIRLNVLNPQSVIQLLQGLTVCHYTKQIAGLGLYWPIVVSNILHICIEQLAL